MGKKKKSLNLLHELDKGLMGHYDSLEAELDDYRKQIAMADKIAERKMRKKLRKNPNAVYSTREQRSVRDNILRNMEKTGFIDRCSAALKAMVPTVVMLARIIASFILCLLQIRPIQKLCITHGWDVKLQGLYNLAMSVNV